MTERRIPPGARAHVLQAFVDVLRRRHPDAFVFVSEPTRSGDGYFVSADDDEYMTTSRTDTHAPSAFDPAEYEEVGYYDNHPEEGGMWIAREYRTHDYFDGNNAQRNRCDHCGAGPLRYGVIFHHAPSDKLVVVGQTCSARLNLGSRTEWERKQSIEQARREAAVAQFKAQSPVNAEVAAFLNECTATPYVDDETGDRPFARLFPAAASSAGFIFDLTHKLNRYGSLSEKQVEAVVKIMRRNAEWLARNAEQAEQMSKVEPLVEGRYEIEGEIASTKFVENDFGGALKMLVRLDAGTKVWGTVPSAIYDALPVGQNHDWFKGQRVSFTAKVERSNDDQHFGFYSRPTKARIIAPSSGSEGNDNETEAT